MGDSRATALRTLFRPHRIALVGASDKSSFSNMIYKNLTRYGFGDNTYLVNRRGVRVHDSPTYTSCTAIGEHVDLAYLMVPQAAVHDALGDVAEAGITSAVVLAGGYGETGEEGRRAEAALVARAQALGITFLGPNQIGFANFVAGVPAIAMSRLEHRLGSLALVSQSGAVANAMVDYAAVSGAELSYVITLGNEAMVTAGDVLDYLVEDEHTRAVAVYLESVRDPEAFADAARRALAAGKAIVVLKTGASEVSARSATAHTGALVGDSQVFAAVCAELGVALVDTVEDLILTGNTAARIGPIARPGLAIASISGGACSILADRAAARGVPLPALAPDTIARIREVVPGYGTVLNPLDVTGAALTDQRLFEQTITALSDDPQVGVVGVVNILPHTDTGTAWQHEGVAAAIGRGATAARCPVVYIGQAMVPVTDYTRDVLGRAKIDHVVPGLEPAVTALGHLGRWSEAVGRARARPQDDQREKAREPGIALPPGLRRTGSLSEQEARQVLETAGVPVIPSVVAATEEEAAAAAAELGGPVAMKVVSAQILHKSDIGGVLLGIEGDQQVRTAFHTLTEAAAKVPGATVEGVLVSPMRTGGIELLVGVTRDPQWGLVLAIAVGGVLVEVLQDAALARVPVDTAAATTLLHSLRGAELLRGYRGSPVADVPRLARTIARVSRLAAALGDELEALEINPLRVHGSTVEALDAVLTWRDR
ncbi:pimeloyl-CoA synthetase [Streptomyces albus]|uniref:Pimeloyl-CoA synthetase n=1 Tax=Streptomyces albus (strain ATCC 21838 / DSM 41398 / FERM P-419 / JCM 4703 / NBRC 107858) TaxID=1081613 RepID=A0A0B5EM25_STRA4|nr:pimeloyl-CoA synthetase [Streptomyces albus]AOU74710.1 pimeloyl-CoA synthetase [Streptomyces albus]AYN30521.1 CoA-binding protein [Streptomyces albus]